MSDDEQGGAGDAGAGGGADGAGGQGAAGGIDPLTGKPIEAASGDGGTGGDDGGADPDWYQHLSADPGEEGAPSIRDWVKARGAKSIDDLAKAARDNQKALRDSGRIKIPGEGASEAEIAEYRKAIGVPDDPNGYSLPEFKDADGNPVELDTEMLDGIFASAHKRGGPKELIEGIVADYIELQRADIDRRTP